MILKRIAAAIAAAGVLTGGGTIAADKAIDPYDSVGTTLQAKTVSTLPEAGTEKAIMDTTKPKITLEKWNGEVAMGVTYDSIKASGARPFLSKNMEWKQGAQTMQVVPLEKSAELEDGGYEINILVNSRPASNVFTFSIDGADQLDFFYQPPLTEKEIMDGASRPDSVVGSYAVYYKSHANHIEGATNYASGKAYQIYRPLVTDANGATVWADLSYLNGNLTVTVPQSFLDSAAYPVKVDPTFGYTTIGGTTVSSSAIKCSSATPSDTTSTTKFTVYVSNIAVARSLSAALYNDSSNAPGAFIAVDSGDVTIQAVQWYDITVAGAFTASTQYWLCEQTSAGALRYYDAAGAGASQSLATTYDTWPAFSGAGTGEARVYSIYATYTATAAAVPADNGTIVIFN